MTRINAVQEADSILSIDRTFQCSRARLWRAWTDAAEIAQWFGPEGCTAPGAVADVRVGGRYSFPITGQDGSLNTVVGEYTQVEEPAHLAFSWSWIQEEGRPGQRMTITLDFEDLGDETRMRMAQTNFIDDEARDLHNQGWTSSMISLERHLATVA